MIAPIEMTGTTACHTEDTSGPRVVIVSSTDFGASAAAALSDIGCGDIIMVDHGTGRPCISDSTNADYYDAFLLRDLAIRELDAQRDSLSHSIAYNAKQAKHTAHSLRRQHIPERNVRQNTAHGHRSHRRPFVQRG